MPELVGLVFVHLCRCVTPRWGTPSPEFAPRLRRAMTGIWRAGERFADGLEDEATGDSEPGDRFADGWENEATGTE